MNKQKAVLASETISSPDRSIETLLASIRQAIHEEGEEDLFSSMTQPTQKAVSRSIPPLSVVSPVDSSHETSGRVAAPLKPHLDPSREEVPPSGVQHTSALEAQNSQRIGTQHFAALRDRLAKLSSESNKVQKALLPDPATPTQNPRLEDILSAKKLGPTSPESEKHASEQPIQAKAPHFSALEKHDDMPAFLTPLSASTASGKTSEGSSFSLSESKTKKNPASSTQAFTTISQQKTRENSVFSSAPEEQETAPPLISDEGKENISQTFRLLGENMLHTQGAQTKSVEDVVLELLRPMLRDWLENNLPTLVERLVYDEIQKITRRTAR